MNPDRASRGALLLVLALAGAYLSFALVLMARLPANPWTLTLAFGAWLVLVGFGIRPTKAEWFLALLLVVASVAAATFVYDTSFDGQIYHQDAVVQLHAGWNPFHEPSLPVSPWVRHYPKAPWMLAAFLYEFVPHIEAGKAANALALVASLLAAYAALASLLPGRARWVPATLALGLACNPVVLTQLFTYYNDGLSGSLALTYVAFLVLYLARRERTALLGALACLPVLLNAKFTAIVAAGVWSIAFVAALYLRRAPERKSVLIALVLVAVASLTAVGFNPYVTNMVSKGNPFFPLAGAGKADIMTLNLPAEFGGKNRFEKLVLSMTGGGYFPLHREDFTRVEFDTRIGGFGPLTLWIALAAGALFCLLILLDVRRGALAGIAAGLVLVTVFLHPECWWARYVPQLWLVPWIVAAAGLASPRRVPRVAAWVVLAVVGVNAAGCGGATFMRQLHKSQELRRFLGELHGRSVVLTSGGFTSVPVHLGEWGIPFRRETGAAACDPPARVPFSDVDLCVRP